MLIVLSGFGVWLPVALLASTLPVLAVVLRDAVRQHEFRMRATPLERRAWYHDWLLTTGDAAPEVRCSLRLAITLSPPIKGTIPSLQFQYSEPSLTVNSNCSAIVSTSDDYAE